MADLDFNFAWGGPRQTAGFRLSPEDFVVDEQMSVDFSGEGEHFWLHIQKRGENTEWVAKKLASYFGLKKMDVGYGGKKDRHAVTSQWFSLYLPGKSHHIDWQDFIEQSQLDATLLASASHSKKLRMGEHSANRFQIRLQGIEPTTELEQTLLQIKEKGVPNYFGEQRFGRDGGNLERAAQWVKDVRSVRNRNTRSILMSSARSYLFNKVLSERVAAANWLSVLDGDPELEPSGPLWGRGLALSHGACLEFEQRALEAFELWCSALENVGLQQQRRALVLRPRFIDWEFVDKSVVLKLELEPGQFATSVLRELAILEQPER
ncbi:tRNA pseudouridine(13) synthase TruD [Agaribacterium haliotis]|uniref:tRNA pseudouridine(13) synthase TruD n=1 Tax=Agaribacterium haliotis TaxID=2013869 RepID=UPI000BB59B59|nr:tRNA pseudouridine(13) synthase TruD [Agaribacterium haliotis]